jgi:hypothetical protein
VIYQEAFGLANREWKIPNSVDTKFCLASVIKQLCSMIIMQIIQDEKLALNDPITKHLLYYRKDQGVKLRYTIAWNINLEFLTSQIPSTTEIQLLVFYLRKMTSFSGSAVATLRITLEKFTATVTPVM